MEVLKGFVCKIATQILNPIMTLLALGAFLIFVWGVIDFIRHADDAKKRAEGQQHIIWGLIGLAIIFGAKGIIAIAANTFGLAVPGAC